MPQISLLVSVAAVAGFVAATPHPGKLYRKDAQPAVQYGVPPPSYGQPTTPAKKPVHKTTRKVTKKHTTKKVTKKHTTRKAPPKYTTKKVTKKHTTKKVKTTAGPPKYTTKKITTKKLTTKKYATKKRTTKKHTTKKISTKKASTTRISTTSSSSQPWLTGTFGITTHVRPSPTLIVYTSTSASTKAASTTPQPTIIPTTRVAPPSSSPAPTTSKTTTISTTKIIVTTPSTTAQHTTTTPVISTTKVITTTPSTTAKQMTTTSMSTAKVITTTPSTTIQQTTTTTTTSDDACITTPEEGTYCGFINPEDPCAPQPDGYGPAVEPDTAAAFLAYPEFHAQAAAAPLTVSAYTKINTDITAAIKQDSYMGLHTLHSYDVAGCSAQCDSTNGCSSFNLYVERDPSQNPTNYDNDAPTVWGYYCPAPKSITNYKCALFADAVSADDATNTGGWRGSQFEVVVSGSVVYTKKTPSS